MAKVIDMMPRLKQNTDNTHESDAKTGTELLKIDDFRGKFSPVLVKERRQVERTILSDLISGMIILPEQGLLKVDLHDISSDGLSFTMDPSRGAFKVGEEIALRVYINRKTYFPLVVRIKHATFDTQENVIRHGVEYMKSLTSDVALQHFINFIIAVNEGLKIDDGDFLITPVS